MKTLKSLLYALAATVLLAGCSDDETYTAGEQENPDCYGVYFPSQANIADRELDPADEPALSFTVRRTKSEGEITVPVTVTSAQGDDIFEATAIEFADGQEETTFVISFPDTEVGTTYTCEVNVDDPLYASTYTERSTGFSFSITRVKWVLVTGPNGETTGKWRDEFITEFFELGNEGETPYAEKDVEIYERADKPGYYRIKDIYDAAFVTTLFGKIYTNTLPVPTNIIIDATKDVTDADVAGVVSDKTSVYFPAQTMGFQYTDNGEDFWIVSYCKENYPTSSADKYGEIKDGILSFPDEAILLTLPSVWEKGSYYTTNTSMTRLIFPGFKAYDYSLVLKNAEPADGEIKIGVKFGADVAKVKYAFFEGELSDALADIRSGEIESGETASQELTATGTLTVSFEATGVYSIVANVYNAKNELVGVEHLSFGYVKAGDEEENAIVMTVQTELTNQYAAEGYTPENSIRAIMYGKNIVSGYYGLFKTSSIAGLTDAELTAGLSDEEFAFTEEELAKVNSTGLTPFFTDLNKGTSYTLLVLVNNGYYSKIFAVEQSTQGDPDPFDIHYTFSDLEDGVDKTELFATTWNYYAVDAFDKTNSKRQFLGTVTFSENTEDDADGADFVNGTGFFSSSAKGLSTKDDTFPFQYTSDGLLVPTPNNYLGEISLGGGTYYIANGFTELESTSVYRAQPGTMYGGYVADGFIAFTPNPNFVSQNHTFVGLFFGAYESYNAETGEVASLAGGMEHFQYLLLVDPESDPHGAEAAAVAEALAAVRPTNYVELRGAQLAAAIWNERIDRFAGCGNRAFKDEFVSRAVEATTSFEAGMRLQRGSIDTRIADKALRVR